MSQILAFYAQLARFQSQVYDQCAQRNWPLPGSGPLDSSSLAATFSSFLALIAQHGSLQLRTASAELKQQPEATWSGLLSEYWQGSNGEMDVPREFACRAFLQPIAELSRNTAKLSLKDYSEPVCPYCSRPPGVAILRPEGEGGKRFLQCSFCLGEWSFRRILCPSCGEEDNGKLPVYTAEEFDDVRVEACDSCKHYIKCVDLTKDGRAEPVVDEIAAAALDLWARDHGYTKIALNLMGM